MQAFLSTYGLWAVFVLALFENDLAFIAIGVVAKLGTHHPATPDLNIFAAVPLAIFGALLHDLAWFSVALLNSERIRATGIYRRIGPTIERFAQRFGLWEIFLARFIYGTRTPTAIFWGIQRIPWFKFAAIEVLALAIWGSVLVAIGFHSTGWALRLLGKVEGKHHPHLLIGALVVAFVIIVLLRLINRRRLAAR